MTEQASTVHRRLVNELGVKKVTELALHSLKIQRTERAYLGKVDGQFCDLSREEMREARRTALEETEEALREDFDPEGVIL